MAKRIIILNGSPRNNFVLQQFYTSLCRIFFFTPTKKITVRAAVTKIAIVSAIGAAKSIPSMPRKSRTAVAEIPRKALGNYKYGKHNARRRIAERG